jgi:putative inorganic carbon (hco3(-)) transporter
VTARRVLPLAVPAIAAVIVLAAAQAASAESAVPAFERGVGVVAAVGLAVVAVLVRPAWTLSVALVLSVFSGHWDELGAPVALDRVALGLGVASLLMRELRHRDGRLETRPIDWLLMLVALYAFVSAFISGTLDDSHARFTLLDRYGLVPFLMFFLAPFAFRTQRERHILLGMLVALGAYLGVTALLETTGPRGLVVPTYITDPTIGIHFDRARGPFVEAVGNGVTMFFCAAAATIAFLQWRRTRWRAAALLVVGLDLLGVLFTVTRTVWIGAAVGMLLALLATRETRRFLLPVAVTALVLVLGAFATVPGLQSKAQKRSDDQAPLYDRRNSNAAAVRMVEAKPLVGFGWGQFPKKSFDYYKQSPDYPLTAVPDLHNVYLSNAVELGLIGAGLWAVGLIAAIGGALARPGPRDVRAWKVGLVAIAASLFVAWGTAPSSYVAPTLILWTWAGVVWGGRSQEGQDRAV